MSEQELRQYQEDILEVAKTCNVLCVLPTGMGKTLIAIRLAQHVKQCAASADQQPRTTFFLAPTCNLVYQQAERAREQAPELVVEEFAHKRFLTAAVADASLLMRVFVAVCAVVQMHGRKHDVLL